MLIILQVVYRNAITNNLDLDFVTSLSINHLSPRVQRPSQSLTHLHGHRRRSLRPQTSKQQKKESIPMIKTDDDPLFDSVNTALLHSLPDKNVEVNLLYSSSDVIGK